MKEATMYAQVTPLAHVWRHDKRWNMWSSFFSSFRVVRPTQIFVIFQKKSNDLVKPFFTWNNSLIWKMHIVINSIKKNRNIFYSYIMYLTGGGPRLSEISCAYDPPIYDITSGWRVAALFSREAQRWTPDAIWFSRCFYPQANGIMYLECRESWEGI